ncbi:hypothetical protein FRACA_60057 [Frankia canadensis]|uniref:Uncharacterized protein n=1 Tax=Frankia canadensis TaxID=1836972 RepID=A0A2I2KZI0_9ACTN|nr:hypothetical protein FRACA_60057 [Frankia canadensis]SOU58361.1 hypothetical protein FRACA_60057 [Frankia canadensis]
MPTETDSACHLPPSRLCRHSGIAAARSAAHRRPTGGLARARTAVKTFRSQKGLRHAIPGRTVAPEAVRLPVPE